ncbi:hypothetical protein ABZP36_024161 [Zizania latifolia]
MTHVSKLIQQVNQDFFPISPTDYNKFMILSLGTGMAKNKKYTVFNNIDKWGVFEWLINKGGVKPLIDSFSQGSTDMVNIHTFVLLHAPKYLRIQYDKLKGKTASVDVSTRRTWSGLSTSARSC